MAGGLYPPIEVIATWKINYTNPVRSGQSLVILVGVLLAVAYVVVALRLYARFVLVKSAGVDDALIIFNMVGFLSPKESFDTDERRCHLQGWPCLLY
jgi:hypothetical protein